MNETSLPPNASGAPLLELQDVFKSFSFQLQTVDILKGISFTVHRGDVISIIGASGAGKSTLLYIMGTLDQPTRGSIAYEGRNLLGLSESALAEFRNRSLGFVFQFHHLLPEFTALENTYLPALIQRQPTSKIQEAAKALLADLGLSHRFHHKPGELSGGEQQRVAVARALIRNPDLVLADEPTGNLDTHTGDALFESLQRLNQQRGTAFVIVTHNQTLAARSDRVIQLQDGVVLEDRWLRDESPSSL